MMLEAESPGTLDEALETAGIELLPEQVQKLEAYCRLLWDWNSRLNLTRHTTFEKFVTRDVVDTRVLSAQLREHERVLDVGTGGGVPGVVLAILRPDLQVELSESVGKKARAVGEIVERLGLPVRVHMVRAQDVLAAERYDTLVVRAVAPLAKLLGWFADRWKQFDRLLVIKGPAWVEERHAAREKNLLKDLQLRKLAAWPLPGTSSESVLLEIRRPLT